MVDLYGKEVILTDLYVSGRAFHNSVENSVHEVSLLTKELSNFIHTRPTMNDLAKWHALSRNATVVHDKEAADISFGVKDCTYNASDVEKILAELI